MSDKSENNRARWDDETVPSGLRIDDERAILLVAHQQHGTSPLRVVGLLTDFMLAVENGEVVDHDTASNCFNWMVEFINGPANLCDNCDHYMSAPMGRPPEDR